MTYAGKHPSVYRVSQTYSKGVRRSKDEMKHPGKTAGAFGQRAEVVCDHCTSQSGRDHSPLMISPRRPLLLASNAFGLLFSGRIIFP